jgi:hypothetical protein
VTVRILFTKTSLTHHALEVVRDDGSRERAVLETKSLMPHDLIHHAFESEARLDRSFWGLLGAGFGFLDLRASPTRLQPGKDEAASRAVPSDELVTTEMLVGALTGFLRGKAPQKAFLEIVAGMLGAHGKPMPDYLDEAFLARFSERFRGLLGRWNAAKKGEPMELHWPAAPAQESTRRSAKPAAARPRRTESTR